LALLDYIREDINRYLTPVTKESKFKLLKILFTIYDREELWAIITYRFGRWILANCNIPVLRSLAIYFYDFLAKLNRLATGINIWAEAKIGKGLYLGHYPMVIGPVVIGEYCNISANCIIGLSGREEDRGAPIIGDRVFIGPNSVVVGKIKIGNGVAIGAGSVVTKDVPASALVAGNPARVINYRGSEGYIEILDESQYFGAGDN
jgi:serine O-acetyltransferase